MNQKFIAQIIGQRLFYHFFVLVRFIKSQVNEVIAYFLLDDWWDVEVIQKQSHIFLVRLLLERSLLNVLYDSQNRVYEENEDNYCCHHCDIAIKHLLRIARCHISVSDSTRSLNSPIERVDIPDLPFKILYQIQTRDSGRICQPQQSLLIIGSLLNIEIVINSKIATSAPIDDKPNEKDHSQKLIDTDTDRMEHKFVLDHLVNAK
jgi:hypothetical protein